MNIAIWAGGMPFDGNTIRNGESLGGSESAAYYMARALAALKHRVTLFTSKQSNPSTVDGVTYVWHGEPNQQAPFGQVFHGHMQNPHDVLIMQRHPMAFVYPYNTKLNVWWLHDLALIRHVEPVHQSLVNIDLILTVSEFHRKQVCDVYGIENNGEFVIATHNGVDYNLFENLDQIKRQPRSMIYTARPERGLINLVGEGGIMELLPDVKLSVCTYNNVAPEMKPLYDYLWRRCEELPNVTNLGFLSKKKLAIAEAQHQIHIYPTAFEDTSCIAAMEAAAAGTPFISSDIAALPETTAGGGAILIPLDSNGAVDKQAFADDVTGLLNDKNAWQSLSAKQRAKKSTWGSAAIQWEMLMYGALQSKCNNKARLQKHLERMSDIVTLTERVDGWSIPHVAKFYDFYKTGDFAGHYARYYDEHEKGKGVVYGPEDLTNQPRFEHTHRMLAAMNPKRVLDYGCAHGHYTNNLAKRMPEVSFTGVDISASNIEAARSWAEPNAEFVNGQHGDVKGVYDVILMCEVIEHMANPQSVIEALHKHLAPGGYMLISTPWGPWELEGMYKPENAGWRAHLHHFEDADITDIFGGQNNLHVMSIPYRAGLGHYIYSYQLSGKPLGTIDMERKISMQSPPETMALCMIVKDGGKHLDNCLSRVADICDEIIIGVDETTTDNTREIAARYGAQMIDIKSPLETGFDAARNLTIAEATADWILWLDADEGLVNAGNLLKYLRRNVYNGYMIPQHHFAVEPLGCFKTDYPVRLFRNRKGIRFIGVVHEHPEVEINKGVGKAIVIGDVSITHPAYETEAIRRARFQRNFPLMVRDRETYPERGLGKMLWIRDLGHMINYDVEQNRGAFSPQSVINAQRITDEWRDLIRTGQIKYAVDALPYLTMASEVLTHGQAVEIAIDLDASRLNGGPKMGNVIRAKFVRNSDAKELIEKLFAEKTSKYEEKYF